MSSHPAGSVLIGGARGGVSWGHPHTQCCCGRKGLNDLIHKEWHTGLVNCIHNRWEYGPTDHSQKLARNYLLTLASQCKLCNACILLVISRAGCTQQIALPSSAIQTNNTLSVPSLPKHSCSSCVRE